MNHYKINSDGIFINSTTKILQKGEQPTKKYRTFTIRIIILKSQIFVMNLHVIALNYSETVVTWKVRRSSQMDTALTSPLQRSTSHFFLCCKTTCHDIPGKNKINPFTAFKHWYKIAISTILGIKNRLVTTIDRVVRPSVTILEIIFKTNFIYLINSNRYLPINTYISINASMKYAELRPEFIIFETILSKEGLNIR